MPNFRYTAVGVAAALASLSSAAQNQAPVEATLPTVNVSAEASRPNWQKMREKESRVRAMGATPDEATLETSADQHITVINADELNQVNALNTLDVLERDFILRWERQVNQLSWTEAPAASDWQRRELINYASTRRDALKALAQAFETRQTVWVERSRALQVQADNILLQMRLRKSVEAGAR